MTSGSICLIQYPFTDGSGAKVRPVLVVSQARFNRGDDVVVVPICSRPDSRDPFSVFIASDSPSFAATKLKQASAVKWAKPFTASKRLVLRRLGRLDPTMLGEVLKSVVQLFADANG